MRKKVPFRSYKKPAMEHRGYILRQRPLFMMRIEFI